ncbi:MAG: hypothetical protein CMM52_06610 [Rhodospirillaceae bacterium]|nr:hypothetical protein [Rhodospirillaceae bacterium]
MSGDGDDIVDGGAGNDTIEGDDGNDSLSGGDGIDTLYGNDDNDTLRGNDGDDSLNGGNGDDTLIGGAGADAINGDAGTGWASYIDSTVGVTADISGGVAGTNDALGDTYTNIENLRGTLYGDTLYGNSGANLFWAESGDDTVYGGAGNDTIHGSNGVDTLYGDDGNDYLHGGNDNDTLTGGLGDDNLYGNAGDDTYSFDRGDGGDNIYNTGESSSNDKVSFAVGVDEDQLWFQQIGNDLRARIIGTNDFVQIKDWYVGTDNRLDFEVSDGSDLVAADVQNLVNAMASFSVPAVGDTELSDTFSGQDLTDLNNAITANWT